MLRTLILTATLCLLTGCGTASTPEPMATAEASAWGAPVTVARAQQGDPPVVWVEPDGLTAAWVGADEAGVHENVTRLRNGTPGPVTVLPLPPRHPYAFSGQSANSGLHLFWLDAGENGETRLFSALLSSSFTVVRGPTTISDQPTQRYATVAADDGAVWVAWSGGLIAEPALYAQYVDGDGRPRPPRRIAADASDPALARAADGTVSVFWIGGSDGQVYRAALALDGATDVQAITASVHLAAGDQLDSLRAGLDETHAYLFWNIERADGATEVWMASAPLPSAEATAPIRLAAVRRIGPLAGQRESLAAAAQTDGGVAALTFKAGVLADTEPIADDTGLLAAPSLLLGADGGLIAAWAEPETDGYAALKVAIRNAP